MSTLQTRDTPLEHQTHTLVVVMVVVVGVGVA